MNDTKRTTSSNTARAMRRSEVGDVRRSSHIMMMVRTLPTKPNRQTRPMTTREMYNRSILHVSTVAELPPDTAESGVAVVFQSDLLKASAVEGFHNVMLRVSAGEVFILKTIIMEL